jgi:hypothetical protein
MIHPGKGIMKSLMSLIRNILIDIEDMSSASTLRDYKTIAERVEDEGLSFLTITLANFGKDLQKGLDRGLVAPSDFVGFHRSGALPRLFGGLLERIFDKESGVLLDTPCVASIAGLYQITSMFSKIEVPCSDARIAKAIQAYVECDAGIKVSDSTFTGDIKREFSLTSQILFSNVLRKLEGAAYESQLIPRHGPGKVAERLSYNRKYDSMHWTTRLEHVFPHMRWMYPSYSVGLSEPFGSVDIREPGAETPVRVVTVPKTLKAPRVIAMEPTCMQFVQQSVSQALMREIESDSLIGSMIGFTDQIPNQEMARVGSLDGSLATLDLSEASDRVSNQHVLELFSPSTFLSEIVQACRSRKADVPGFGVIRLAKFASMGSALCFPVEAMVFLTVAFMGIARELNTPVTPRLISQFKGSVRVYGDDIIVPAEFAVSVSKTLDLLGYKVNTTKSFWTGLFRESCGGDFYAGNRITPVKLRTEIPEGRMHAENVVSFSAFRNQLFRAGYWKATRWCDSHLEKILGGIYPAVEDTANAVGRHTFLPVSGVKMCSDLHRPLVKAYVQKSKPRVDRLEGYGALMKFFLKVGDEPILGDHLIHAGRPQSSSLKLRWTSTH